MGVRGRQVKGVAVSDDREYTADEAAALLGLTPEGVRSAIKEGRLQTRKIGARLHVITAAELERYKAEHLGKQGWDKRRDPRHTPTRGAEYARAYRARKKARQSEENVVPETHDGR